MNGFTFGREVVVEQNQDLSRYQNRKIAHLELPEAGGIVRKIEESLYADSFTGNLIFMVPFPLTPCRNLDLRLLLSYHSGGENGVFGRGFSLDIPYITRKNDRGIPCYDATDIFLSTEYGELVKAEDCGEDGERRSVYCARHEYAFSEICLIQEGDNSYFRIREQDHTVKYYGRSQESRIDHPQQPGNTFCWFLTESEDRWGNKVRYYYDQGEGNCYIRRIDYGNYQNAMGEEDWCFSAAFSYEENRKDCCRNYRSGFLCRTDRLCTQISMIHRFEGEQTVRMMEFSYDRTGIALLREIRLTGIRKEGERELTEEYPPISLFYRGSASWNPVCTRLFLDGTAMHANLEQASFIDLYGDGLTGILGWRDGAPVYFQPEGNGHYRKREMPDCFPTEMREIYQTCRPVSLEGNGAYDFVVLEPGHAGYYAQENGRFQPFVSFASAPVLTDGQHTFWADTQGDRKQHLFTIDGETGYYYPSLGRKGFAPPLHCRLPAGFTVGRTDGVEQKELFADVFDDGLQHRIRVENGQVTCWPCMGYGVYGEAVILEGAPGFADFDARCVYFADLDGTGAEDYLYLYRDGIKIYRNLGGTFEQEGRAISLPVCAVPEDTVYFTDLDGTGCQSLILMKAETHEIYSVHFCAGEKPGLLTGMDTNMGKFCEITYRTLADRFLEERKKGLVWKNRPWLSVQTVDSICCHDRITGRRQIYEYTGREAWYDLDEAVFGGFGEMEIRSWEEWEEDGGNEDLKEKEPGSREAYIEGSCRKCWNYIPGQTSLTYPGRPDFIAPVWEDMSGGISQEAEKALTGVTLREELYGFWPLEEFTDEKKRHQITQYGYEVRELHPPQPGCRGRYFGVRREALHFLCEGGSAEDARVFQEVEWDRDEYGYARMSALVWYRRKRPRSKEQEETRMLVTERSFCHQKGGAYLLGTLLSEKEKEIRCREGLLSFAELCRFVKQAEKTYCRREEFLYWDNDQKDCLFPGQAGELALLHHSRLFAFPTGSLTELWDEITEEKERELGRAAGLVQDEEGWWCVSPVTVYLHRDGHYLPEMLTSLEKSDESYFCTRAAYDPYHLFAVTEDTYVEEQVWNRVQAEPDYQAMQYWKTEDWNGNFREAVYTPLGDLAAVSGYGSEQGEPAGDRPVREYVWNSELTWEEACRRPDLLLQGASASYLTDWTAWKREKKPVCRAEAEAMQYADVLENAGAPRRSMLRIHFFDGNLRPIETQARDGKKWISCGRVRYSFDGEQILLYAPDRIEKAGFSGQKAARIREELWYDVQGRTVKQRRPKGEDPSRKKICTIFKKSEYFAWQELHYDENDTVSDSEYGRAWEGHRPADAWEEACFHVLERSRGFYDTPVCKWYDSMGRPVREIVEQEGGTGYAISESDIYGRIIKMSDPRLEASGKENLCVYRNNTGNAVRYESADAGTRFFLYNSCGNLVFSADQAGHRVHFKYDALQRLTEERVEDAGWTKRIFYGDGITDAKKDNRVGQPVKILDQAGEEIYGGFTMAGKVLKKGRRFWKDYSADTAEHAGIGGLEQEIWTEEIRYNSLGMPVVRQMPDGSRIFWQYDDLGRVSAVECEKRGEKKQDVWKHISYDADGRMRETEYGNGVKLRVETRDASGELYAVSAAGPSRQMLLDYRYFCDMAGNVSVICENGEQETLWEYVYDAFYQLTGCMGREENEKGELERYREQFRYDGSGNLISIYHESPSSQYEQNYPVCEDSSRLCGEQNVYNENGELLENGAFRKLCWDHEGNLREVMGRTEGKTQTAEYYCYDHTGMRVRRVTRLENGGVEEKRYLDGYEVKTAFSALGDPCYHRKTIHIQGSAMAEVHFDCWDSDDSGREIKVHQGWKETWCVDDHRRSVVLELDENGDEISREEYGAFGTTVVFQQREGLAAGKEYRFGGKEKDEYTGLIYFGSRYYDGIRFLRADEIDYLCTDRFTGINLYSYCRNNPMTYLDPAGHCIHYFAAPYFHEEAENDSKALSKSLNREYEQGKDRKLPVITHKISSADQFVEEWNAMEDSQDTIAVIRAHGNGNCIQMGLNGEFVFLGKRTRVENKRNVRAAIFLSCHAAYMQNWGIAGRMLKKISQNGIVIGANDFVKKNGTNPQGPGYITEFTNHDKCSFYAIRKDGEAIKGRKIGNTIQLFEKIKEIRSGTLTVASTVEMNAPERVTWNENVPRNSRGRQGDHVAYPGLTDLAAQWRSAHPSLPPITHSTRPHIMQPQIRNQNQGISRTNQMSRMINGAQRSRRLY